MNQFTRAEKIEAIRNHDFFQTWTDFSKHSEEDLNTLYKKAVGRPVTNPPRGIASRVIVTNTVR